MLDAHGAAIGRDAADNSPDLVEAGRAVFRRRSPRLFRSSARRRIQEAALRQYSGHRDTLITPRNMPTGKKRAKWPQRPAWLRRPRLLRIKPYLRSLSSRVSWTRKSADRAIPTKRTRR